MENLPVTGAGGGLIYYPDSHSPFINEKNEVLRNHTIGPRPHGCYGYFITELV